MNGNWEWLTLDDVLIQQANRKKVQQGWSPKCHAFPAAPGQWGVLKTTAIQAGRFEPEHNKALPDHLAPKPGIEIESGDLLVTCAGPRSRCGVPTLVRSTPERLMMSGKMYRFRADDRLAPRFLELWLLSPDAQRQIDAMKTGISDSGLNLTHGRFTRLPVPVPPLAEQHRIVDLLEDHLSRLAAADAYLEAAQRRSSVLHDQLLASEVAAVASEQIPLAELLAVGLANGKSVPTEEGGFPVLRLTALRAGRIDLAERKPGAWTAAEAERFLVERGDFLIARGNGSLRLVGRGGLVIDEPDAVAFPDTLIRARPDLTRIDPEFMAHVWNAPSVRRQIEKAVRTTAGIYKVNQKDLATVRLPVPSLADQERVTSAVRESRDALSQLDFEVGRAVARSSALRRSLLGAAFAGRLNGHASDQSEAAEMMKT